MASFSKRHNKSEEKPMPKKPTTGVSAEGKGAPGPESEGARRVGIRAGGARR